MRKICFSDIHGNLKTFEAALDRWAFSKSDELFLLGDYVDRGPDSRGVIDKIWQLQADGYRVNSLKGNHEMLMISDLKNQHLTPWRPLGSRELLASFEADSVIDIPEKYFDWINSLPFYLEVDEFILVHGGLNFEVEDPFSDTYSMVWIRDWYWNIRPEWLQNRIILHGHTPVSEHQIRFLHQRLSAGSGSVLNIDNGCFAVNLPKLGQLCSLDLLSRELRFEPNIDAINP